jgi:hypothetical protein
MGTPIEYHLSIYRSCQKCILRVEKSDLSECGQTDQEFPIYILILSGLSINIRKICSEETIQSCL